MKFRPVGAELLHENGQI